MATTEAQVEEIHQKVSGLLGTDPKDWKKWPGGWKNDIEAALVDAIFSARAVYKTENGKGIYSQVVAWKANRSRTNPDLTALVEEIDEVGPKSWAKSFGNSQTSPGRSSSAPGGRSKAAAVRQAAHLLSTDLEVCTAKDITEAKAKLVKAKLQQVPGIGYATSNYFLMLLGAPGVKPDRMIHRFLGDKFTNAQAEEIITAVAERLGVAPHELDHAIWAYESHLATQR